MGSLWLCTQALQAVDQVQTHGCTGGVAILMGQSVEDLFLLALLNMRIVFHLQ